jgi:heme A synthase
MSTSMSILDTVALSNVFIREWLNGGLIPLNISMMAVITYTVWRQTKFSWGWTKYPGANSACALWWIFCADLMRSVLAWAILRNVNLNDQMVALSYMVIAVIATCATLRCIWCLTPVRGRNITWISALLFTVVFMVMVYVGLFNWV